MKYQTRFQQCPYKTSSGQCVHKHIKNRVCRRKRRCGYSKPSECDMYNEWDKQRKSILKPTKPSKNTIGDKTND